MASVSLCAARMSPSHLIIRTHRLMPRLSPLHFSFRSKNTVRLQKRQGLITVFASNLNPSGGDSLQETSDRTKATDAGRGPPFLTILAGFIVFVLVCWIVGSMVMWLTGLIVRPLISK